MGEQVTMKASFLVDTNVLIDMANGKSPVTNRLALADRIWVSPIVAGEYWAGIRDSRRDFAKQRAFDLFLGLPNVSVPPLTADTAQRYARLWRALSGVGRRIPSNDVWIAAHAMDLGATLVTADAHFDGIPGLDVLFAPTR